MKKGTLAFTAATVLLMSMGLTNPDVEAHQQKITAVLTKIANAGEDDGMFRQYTAAGGDSKAQRQTKIATDAIQHVSSVFLEKGLETTVNVTNYLVCSIGEINLDSLGVGSYSGNKIVSVGLLGDVYSIDNSTVSNIISFFNNL